MAAPDTAAAGALETLAAALGHRDFATVLTTGPHRIPALTVTTRHAATSWDIYARDGWYRHGPDEPIAPLSDPHGAAAIVRTLGLHPVTAHPAATSAVPE